MENKPANEKGVITGIALFCPLLIIGYIKSGYVDGNIIKQVLLQLQVLYVGFLFLLSYYFSHKTFLLRGLMWICENISSPRSRKMAFFYFGFCFLASVVFLIHYALFRV